jgi:addiction module RelE/StbE family toxin
MKVKISPDLQKKLTKLNRENPALFKKVIKQLKLFSNNPKYPSLRVHKLSGKLENMWSISITDSIRMTYLLIDGNEAIFFDIGTHNQVYD